jgi:hypothetical protein
MFDWREYLVFYSVKYVRVLNWRLGLLRICAACVSLPYMIVYCMLYKGNHLKSHEITGHFRVSLQRPTKDLCNPWRIECMNDFRMKKDLRYCIASGASSHNAMDMGWYREKDGVRQDKLPCEYVEELTLVQPDWQGYYIPTRVEEYLMLRRNHTREALNDFVSADGKVHKSGTEVGAPKPIKEYYVADIERYTLKVDHNVNVPGKTWNDHDMKGFYEDRDGNHHTIEIMNSKKKASLPAFERPVAEIKANEKAEKEETNETERVEKSEFLKLVNGFHDHLMPPQSDEDNSTPAVQKVIFRRKGGDIIPLHMLLEGVVGVDLDEDPCSCRPQDVLRRCGVSIDVKIEYENKRSWMGIFTFPGVAPNPYYTISAQRVRDCHKRRIRFNATDWRADPGTERHIAQMRGILLSITSSGSYVMFDGVSLFLYVIASAGFISVSLIALDYVLEYVTGWFEGVKYDSWNDDDFLRHRRETLYNAKKNSSHSDMTERPSAPGVET